MLPPLKVVKHGLGLTTEALARQLAQPGGAEPVWSDLEWRLAMAAAAAHGVSPLLHQLSTWRNLEWRRFLTRQHEHVEHRHQRIAALLQRIDADARSAGLAIVALKGSALHAMEIYSPGDRPMADIDLLVREGDVEQVSRLLREIGYVESFVVWKHRVFRPATSEPFVGLGEHRDTPINIELHTRIQERLPVTSVDITQRIYPRMPQPGINPYPSLGALMSHLLLHAAGNFCGQSVRLLHLNDIALLALRMSASDWDALWDEQAAAPPWWALPALRLTARYYTQAIPDAVLARLEPDCPRLLRTISRRWNLTQVSCSRLWLNAFHGIEWSRSLREVGRYLSHRVRPPREAVEERADMVRTQLWLQGQGWVTSTNRTRMLTWLTRQVPRMDTLYVVRAALEPPAPAA